MAVSSGLRSAWVFERHVPRDPLANLLWRRRMVAAGDADAGVARALKEACRVDPLFWLNGFAWLYEPRGLSADRRVRPFVTWEDQDEAFAGLFECLGRQDVLLEKSREEGATWLCLALMTHQFQFESFQQFTCCSRKADLVDRRGSPDCLFWKIEFLLSHQPTWLRCRWEHRDMVILDEARKSQIIGEPATGDVSRGGRCQAIFLDEFSAFELDDGFKALAATADATNCRIFNGTVQTQGDAFSTVRANRAIRKLRLHFSDDPRKNAGLYRGDAKTGVIELLRWTPKGRPVAECRFPKGYPFIADGRLRSLWYDREWVRRDDPVLMAREVDIDVQAANYEFFGAELVARLADRVRVPLRIGEIEFDPDSLRVVRWVDCPQGKWRLWHELDVDGAPLGLDKYAIGADIAAGTGASNSTMSVVRIATGEKVAECASPRQTPEVFGKLAVVAARWWNGAYLIWDAQGAGRPFGIEVIRLGYLDVYSRKDDATISYRVTDTPGWFCTDDRKYSLLSEYREALSKGTFTNPCRESVQELREYAHMPGSKVVHVGAKTTRDPSGAGAAHGDRVIADALACRAAQDRRGFVRQLPDTEAVMGTARLSAFGRRWESAKADERQRRELAYQEWR